MSELPLYKISELPAKFYIASYQRGYRWDIPQVHDLLSDLDEFYNKEDKKANKFYCLQPLVVASLANDQWELIDGQQRLSTIHLILSYLRETVFSLDYNTRTASKDFINTITEVESVNEWEDWLLQHDQDDKIDNFYFFRAYKTIQKWFKDKDETYKKKFLTGILHETRVIWYPITGSTKKEIYDAFTRLNIGKISLTNAELIKALFLKSNVDLHLRKEIANKWERIEFALHDEHLWYFINPLANETPTRIEFIFDLISNKIENNDTREEKLHTFFYFKDRLANCNISSLWNEIEEVFEILTQWYEDPEFYHYVGYLITIRKKTATDFVQDYKKFKGVKSSFILEIKNEIYKRLSDYKLSDLGYLKSGHIEKITEVLLFFNIQTMMVTMPYNKFPFKQYKKQPWSIEHIHAQNSKSLQSLEEKKVWATDTKSLIISLFPNDTKNEYPAGVVTNLDLVINSEKDVDISGLTTEVFLLFGDHDNNVIDSLSNLALLDGPSNSTLSNRVFPLKRNKILEMILTQEHDGKYIPVCTTNVFLKYYSKIISQIYYWSKSDMDDYYGAIEQSIDKLNPISHDREE